MDITHFVKYKRFFRAIPDRIYSEILDQADFICKIQLNDEILAASAVVSQAMAMNIPVIALENTEASAMLSTYPLGIVIKSLDSEEFFNKIREAMENLEAIPPAQFPNKTIDVFNHVLFSEN